MVSLAAGILLSVCPNMLQLDCKGLFEVTIIIHFPSFPRIQLPKKHFPFSYCIFPLFFWQYSLDEILFLVSNAPREKRIN